MAKAILSHDISPVWVPSPEIEGLRDLAGAHDAATARLAAAKQRLLAFLARRGCAYGGTTPAGNPRRYWTYDFLRWLDKVRPADDGGIRALAALRNEVEAAAETRDDLLAEYRAAVAAGPLSAEVEALQSIKGCGFALAAAFASEVGDFSRFRSGRQVTPAIIARPRAFGESTIRRDMPPGLVEGIDRMDSAGRRRTLRSIGRASESSGFEAACEAALRVVEGGRVPDDATVDVLARRIAGGGGGAGGADLSVYDGFLKGAVADGS